MAAELAGVPDTPIFGGQGLFEEILEQHFKETYLLLTRRATIFRLEQGTMTMAEYLAKFEAMVEEADLQSMDFKQLLVHLFIQGLKIERFRDDIIKEENVTWSKVKRMAKAYTSRGAVHTHWRRHQRRQSHQREVHKEACG